MKGDLYIDFGVAVFLFIFAFISIFYYINSEFDLKVQLEEEQSATLKIQNIFNSLPRETIEKRIITAEGYSVNEFISLAGYNIDLILDEKGNTICFSSGLEGFVANVSNENFYVYSTKASIKKETCEIHSFNNRIEEKISTPIYEDFFIDTSTINSTGEFCNIKPITVFSGAGIEYKNIKICT